MNLTLPNSVETIPTLVTILSTYFVGLQVGNGRVKGRVKAGAGRYLVDFICAKDWGRANILQFYYFK